MMDLTGFRSVCTVQALSALAGGIALLVAPALLLGVFGVEGRQAALVGRLAGGMMFALGATLWAARDIVDRNARIRIVTGNAVCDGLLCLFLAIETWNGVLNAGGYVLSALFLINVGSWLGTRPWQ